MLNLSVDLKPFVLARFRGFLRRSPTLLVGLTVSACVQLLGVDFDGKERGVADSGTNGDAANEGGGGVPIPEPGMERVRLADIPQYPDLFTSGDWFYWNDLRGDGQGVRPLDNARRENLPTLAGANNTTLLHKVVDFEILDADSKSILATSKADRGYSLADGYLFLDREGETMRAISWSLTDPLMRPGDAINTLSPVVLGQTATALILRLPNGDIAQLEGHPPRLQKLGVNAPTAEGATVHPEGLILSSTVGTKTEYVMGDRRLTSEMMDAEGPLARDQRLPIFPKPPPTVLGNWIIYCADAGILAYRPSDRKLVQLQQLSRDDDFWLYGTPAIPNAWAITFAARRGPYEGIYLLRLGRMLQP